MVDTAPNSFEMDYEQLAQAITSRTKVIIPVKVEIVGKAIRCRFQESSAKSVLHLLLW